jgi:DNA repair protein RecO (recombination protein O)
MSTARQVRLQPAFVLHQRPYRDSGRILEMFTQVHGRITLFARGVTRTTARTGAKAASLLPVLQPFHPLLVSWTGRGEAGQFTGAELDGPFIALPPPQLMSACYLNELLMHLLVRHDPYPQVYAWYAQTLLTLKSSAQVLRPLRLFEKHLLEAIGYGLSLEHEAASGVPVQAEQTYLYRLDHGPQRVVGVADGGGVFAGTSLLSLAREELTDARSCADARRLLRAALDRCLEGRQLKTRQVMESLRRLV